MRSQVLVCAIALLALSLDAQSLLRDIAPGAPSVILASEPTSFVTLGSKTYFSAQDRNGLELWRTDGTKAGTELVIDLYPGAGSSFFATTPLLEVGALCSIPYHPA